MTAAIVIELGYRGIHVPADADYARTTCPDCSHERHKSWRKCLSVTIKGEAEAHTYCHHCMTPKRIRA